LLRSNLLTLQTFVILPKEKNTRLDLPESEEFKMLGNTKGAGGLVEMLPKDVRLA
jgi:hypothetical protein